MKLLVINMPADVQTWLVEAQHGPIVDEVDIFTALDSLRRESESTRYDALLECFTHEDAARATQSARLVRRTHSALPLIGIASCARDPTKRATFLESGGDDLLFFPLHREELLATIGACVRRAYGHNTSMVHFAGDDGFVDLHTRRVMVKGRPVCLTSHEYAIVEVLALSMGRAVGREKMLQHVYRRVDFQVDTQIVDVYVAKIRKKLRLHESGFEKHLQTNRGFGFALMPTSDSAS